MLVESKKPRLLVVDDERFNRNVLADLLKPDYTVVLAKNGAQALDKAASSLDLILLDVMMPDMDGYEVCRRLKAEPHTRDIPVIFVTAMQDPEDEMKGLEIGAIDYITKPFSPAIVKARVRNHLELQWARRKAAEAHGKMAALLDNSGQGFLSLGPDLLVDSQFSRECVEIFGEEIGGRSLCDLLFPDDAPAREIFAKNLRRVFEQEDQYIRALYLSLMQTEYWLGGRYLAAEYKMISAARLMVILTDITQQRVLERQMAEERNRLAFIVSAVRDSREFFEVLASFQNFTETTLPSLLQRADAPERTLSEVYREVHTFKGLFSQLDFIHVPAVLHELESQLRRLTHYHDPCDLPGDTEVWDQTGVEQALAQDKAILSETLGRDFFQKQGYITLSRGQVRRLEALAETLLSKSFVGHLDDSIRQLLEEVRYIRYLDFKALLGVYPKAVERLARRQDKQVRAFQIQGDVVRVDPEIYGPLAKALLHLFRNAVDHGIETPEERELLGKPREARVRCRVEKQGNWLAITISDDGRGLALEAIRKRAVEMGLYGPEEAKRLPEDHLTSLIFTEQFSTKEDANQVSGRGIGLCAVKAELERLGGSMELVSHPGKGVSWSCKLPIATSAERSTAWNPNNTSSS